MMINILFNTFGAYDRQNIAVDSFRHIKKMFPNNIRLYNIQFIDDDTTFQNPYPDIEILFKLTDSRDLVLNATKKLPFMNELYNIGLELGGDYTIICNSDVIVMTNLIEKILKDKPECLACSRMDIQHIDSFDQIIQQKIKPVRYCLGQDCFVFQKEWMIRNKSLFQVPFLMGTPVYDIYWTGIIQLFGDKTHILNTYPPVLFHIHHGDDAILKQTPERDWNEQQLYTNPFNKLVFNIMTYQINKNFMKRTPKDRMLNISTDEWKWDEEYFHFMHYNRNVF